MVGPPTALSEPITYPGARRPDRQRTVDSHGLAIAVYEWGDEAAPPILLAHGGMDFAGTFDVFAPMLADAGFRVVSWDHRGHGDSQHAALYNWEADLRDSVAVFDSVSPRRRSPWSATPRAAASCCSSPMRSRTASATSINLDGLPSRRSFPDVSDHQRTKLMAKELTGVARPPPLARRPRSASPARSTSWPSGAGA